MPVPKVPADPKVLLALLVPPDRTVPLATMEHQARLVRKVLPVPLVAEVVPASEETLAVRPRWEGPLASPETLELQATPAVPDLRERTARTEIPEIQAHPGMPADAAATADPETTAAPGDPETKVLLALALTAQQPVWLLAIKLLLHPHPSRRT